MIWINFADLKGWELGLHFGGIDVGQYWWDLIVALEKAWFTPDDIKDLLDNPKMKKIIQTIFDAHNKSVGPNVTSVLMNQSF